MSHHLSPLGAWGRGLAAGAVGTGAITLSQLIEAKSTGGEPPAAAGVVARRVVEGVFQRSVSDEREGMLNQATHWSYGCAWGGVYGLAQGTFRLPTPIAGVLFGSLVGTAATAALPALGLMPPPHQVPPRALATSTFHHLVYGVATACAFRALSRD